MGCERRTLTESAMRGARVRLEPPNKVSARPDAWFLSNSNMSVQGAAAATSIMLMAPRLGCWGRRGRGGHFPFRLSRKIHMQIRAEPLRTSRAEGVCQGHKGNELKSSPFVG